MVKESAQKNTYFVDQDRLEEMQRLHKQDRLLTKSTGGVLPEQPPLAMLHDLLDIACGSAGWTLDVAQQYPNTQVVGIDLSERMIDFDQIQAKARGLENATFKIANILEPFAFPDRSFDVVNARLIATVVPKITWSSLLQECMRVTRPGGIIRLTECEMPLTNIPAGATMNRMIPQAMQRAGLGFSPDGLHIGITPMLGRLLQNAGCQNIQNRAHTLDFSFGTDLHQAMYEDGKILFELVKPFIVATHVASQEEVDKISEQALKETQTEEFCGIWTYLTVWGYKPA